MKLFFKWLGIGIGIGVAVYAAGYAKDCKYQQDIQRERERFGTGK